MAIIQPASVGATGGVVLATTGVRSLSRRPKQLACAAPVPREPVPNLPLFLKNFWPRRFGECFRERVGHGAARAVGVAHILEQVAARSPRPVVASPIAARRPRRVGALGLGAQPRVFLDHLGRNRLNSGFQFAPPIGPWNDARIARVDSCALACLPTGFARCGTGGFSRAICASATNARGGRCFGCSFQPWLFGGRFQIQHHERRIGLRSRKVLARIPRPPTQQEADHEHVPTQNECQNAKLSECFPLSLFHVALLRRTRRGHCSRCDHSSETSQLCTWADTSAERSP